MTSGCSKRGAVPVGLLTEVGPVEAAAVIYLRLWCDGEDGRGKVAEDFCAMLGPRDGNAATEDFDQLCDLSMRHGRRPFMRHQLTCKCLGGDEACFANFIAAASEGQREDAMLLATLMVRPDMASCLVGLAESFGIALRRMAPRQAAPNARTTRTLH